MSDPTAGATPSGGLDAADHARNRAGRGRLLVVYFVTVFVAVAVFFGPGFRTAAHLADDPAPSPWFASLVLRALLTEAVIAAVLYGTLGFGQIGAQRRSGVIRPGGVRQAVRSVTVNMAVAFTISTVVGVVAMSVLALPGGPALAVLAAWLIGVGAQSLSLPLLRRRFTVRPAGPGEAWVRHLVRHTPGDVPHCWQAYLASMTTTITLAGTREGTKLHVVGSDTIDALPDDEIEVLAAHMAGHLAYGHVRRELVWWSMRHAVGAALGVAAVLAVAGWDHRTDPRAYVVFGAAAAWGSLLAMGPIAKRFVKYEVEADWFALDATKNPDAFVRMVTSYTRANAAPVSGRAGASVCAPLPAQQRLALAEQYRARRC